MAGTFTGAPFQGSRPPAGGIDLRGLDLLEIEDGEIVSNTAYYDGTAFARQIGMLPPQDSGAERAMKSAFNAVTKVRQSGVERLSPVIVLVTLTVGLVWWIVAWAFGIKAFDAFLLTVVMVVIAAAATHDQAAIVDQDARARADAGRRPSARGVRAGLSRRRSRRRRTRRAGTVRSSATASASGTSSIFVPRSAGIVPQRRLAAASIAAMPRRVASTRSNAVGVPPRWMWPSTVARVS